MLFNHARGALQVVLAASVASISPSYDGKKYDAPKKHEAAPLLAVFRNAKEAVELCAVALCFCFLWLFTIECFERTRCMMIHTLRRVDSAAVPWHALQHPVIFKFKSLKIYIF